MTAAERPSPVDEGVDRLLAEVGLTADTIAWEWVGGPVRRRPSRRLVLAAALVIVLAAPLAAVGLLRREGGGGGRLVAGGRVLVRLPPGSGAAFVAVEHGILYVASDGAGEPPYVLTAYAASTGRLVRSVGLPSMPSLMAIGPTGQVWVGFYADQAGGPSGVWLLSRDLSRRSAAPGLTLTALVATASDTALFVTQHGLERLRLPAPGRAGRARVTPLAHSSVGPPGDTAPDDAVAFAGHYVVQATNGNGSHSHLVVAGRPHVSFGGASDEEAGRPAAAGRRLFVPVLSGEATAGRLVTLNGALAENTPSWVRHDRLFGATEGVWSRGRTVFVATSRRDAALVCFDSAVRRPSVVTVLSRGTPAVLAATSTRVYLATGRSIALETSAVRAYDVPAACR